MKKLLFENVTCGRCGGGGHYSYNQITGTTCFGCLGAGVKLTVRGRKAQLFLESLRRVTADKLKQGDKYMDDDGRWHTIQSIEPESLGYCIVSEGYAYSVGASTLLRKARSAVEVAEARALALEFQSRLTKTGVVSRAGMDIQL